MWKNQCEYKNSTGTWWLRWLMVGLRLLTGILKPFLKNQKLKWQKHSKLFEMFLNPNSETNSTVFSHKVILAYQD